MNGALAYKDEYEEYEIINGQEYMMARPSIDHIRIEKNIIGLFDRYLKGKKCEAFNEPDVFLSKKDDHIIPDVVIVCNPEIITEKRIEGVPDLIVEILSPSTEKKDRIDKLLLYEKYGVKEYWLVDPIRKSVTVYLLRDGNFELDDIYYFYTEEEWADMDSEERAQAEAQQKIKVSLYEDFIVDVNDVFEDVD